MHEDQDLDLQRDFPAHTYDQWREVVDRQLKGKPFEKLIKQTYEGIGILPMYFSSDLETLDHVDALPGFPPYVRGTRPLGSVRTPWAVAQQIPDADPGTFNRAALQELERGTTTLNVTLDAATQLGLAPPDADDADIGRGGLSVATLQDWSQALAGVDLARVPLLLWPGASGVAAAALLLAHVESSGGRARELSGAIAADPVGVLASTGSVPGGLSRAWFDLALLTAWSRDYAPRLRTVALTGTPWHEAGGSAVQELAFTLAAAVEALRALQTLGLSVNEVAQQAFMSLALGSDFFMEVAKLRAARLLWAQVVDAFGGSTEAQKLHLHVRTSRWNKTTTDPWVNMLRVTTEAFSGICGGCDSLHVGPFDEVLGTPTEFSRRVARNVQIVLREEAHVGRTVDPAGGSWYVERLTDELARGAWALFQDVERQGGLVAALEAGWIQEALEQTASARQKNIDSRKDVFVGTNKYPNLNEKPVETLPVDREALVRARREAVAQYRKERPEAQRATALAWLAAKANTPHAMDAAIAAARAGATVTDLTCGLQQLDAASLGVTPVRRHRGAEPYERLRRTTQAHAARQGEVPAVFLANLGPLSQYKARADFSTAFFELAAFRVLGDQGFDSVKEAAEAALRSGAKVVCICSSDDAYPDQVPPLVQQIKEADAGIQVLLAGYPKAHVEAFRVAGVDDFIHLRSPARSQLESLQQTLGVHA